MSVEQITHLIVLIKIGAPDLALVLDHEPDQDMTYTVKAHYDSDVQRWVCDGDSDNFFLLSSGVLDALVAEAFVKGYPVRYMDSRGNFVRV